ncbi:MAG: hypothetical protein HUU46_10450 [Candidatus Hydrogenedentes bacterium]|nr:hypothetical protein [Candidatus Hydrogenedentota bacterium]
MKHLAVTSILVATLAAPFAFSAAESVERGRDVGDGNVLYDSPYDPKKVDGVTFVAPTVAYPYFEIVVPLGDWTEGKGATLSKVVVNGVDSDSFYVFVDGFSHVQSGWITRDADSAPNVVIVTRSVWHNDEDTTIDIHVSAADRSEPIVKSVNAKAPGSGGVPKGWTRYQSLVLTEPAGLARENEPVEISLTARAEDCADIEKELRLFSVDDGGALTPVAVQTFNPRRFIGRPPGTSNPNYLQHPSQMVEAVFLASVPALASRVYVALYGNDKPSPAPAADTDLKVGGDFPGVVVENKYFVTDLDDSSGQVKSFRIKGRDDKPAPLLTNSLTLAAHWNPDSFSDNGKWGHTFAWNPPDDTTVTANGPIMFRITNRGRMPDWTPQVYASVTYTFYSNSPYMKCTTVTEVRDELNASAIRNGELVLDTHLVDHFVWREKNGALRTIRTAHGPNWQDEWGTRVDQDVPWLAMTNESEGYGVGEVIASSISFNTNRGEATTHRAAFYLYYHHFWNVPLTYFTRGWVYPFSDYQRGPIVKVDPGSTYVEKMAFYPVYLGDGDERYAAFDKATTQIQQPLVQRWGR